MYSKELHQNKSTACWKNLKDSLLSFDYRQPTSPQKAPRENLGKTKGSLILQWGRLSFIKSKITARDGFRLQKILFIFIALFEVKKNANNLSPIWKILAPCKLISLNSGKSYMFSHTLEGIRLNLSNIYN